VHLIKTFKNANSERRNHANRCTTRSNLMLERMLQNVIYDKKPAISKYIKSSTSSSISLSYIYGYVIHCNRFIVIIMRGRRFQITLTSDLKLHNQNMHVYARELLLIGLTYFVFYTHIVGVSECFHRFGVFTIYPKTFSRHTLWHLRTTRTFTYCSTRRHRD